VTPRQTILIGSVLGGLAVALGAFGAHAFKDLLIAYNREATYELAVRYHSLHALALLFISLRMDRVTTKTIKGSAAFMLGGTVFFSGSLYVMALFNTTKVAFITPIGGIFLLIGWGLLFYSVWKNK
jgi:uncharacterized membrane protein YgdD (TMEM256/DUF423 family)